jgi:putative ABC transport system substrate-binding protein
MQSPPLSPSRRLSARREFITLLAGAAAWPLGARAQATRVPTVGFLGPTAPQAWTAWTKAFVDRFAELGWVDGHTVKIVYRWANGQIDHAAKIAAELVALKVD